MVPVGSLPACFHPLLCVTMNGMFASTILIASCYFIAFLCELLRLTRLRWWFRDRVFTFCLVLLGFLYHTAFLCVWHVVADHPLGGVSMLFFVSAWGLVLISLFWTYGYPNIPFGIIVLPLALLLLGGGCLSASTIETTGLSLRSLAKMLHVASATGFVIALAVWGICSVLYLVEVRLLRKKRSLAPPTRLPSLEWSATLKRMSLVLAAFCLFLCGLGIVLFWLS